MSDDKLLHDATASTKGTIYQTYVALLKCFEMISGEKVVIEKLGDVTSHDQQVETKFSTSPLTDSHINFWKTLRNWMQEGFDVTAYTSLILYTTQHFGENARIAEWNEADIEKRLAILKDIKAEAEVRETTRAESGSTQSRSIPESLSFQRIVLQPSKSDKLRKVAAKIFIAACSPGMSSLYKEISDRYCKHILRGKCCAYLDALLGFLISPELVASSTWEVSFEQFSSKVRELSPQYSLQTHIFPRKYLADMSLPDTSERESYLHRGFVQKIAEIHYHDKITEAIRDYLAASRTVLEELASYEVPKSLYEDYSNEVLSVFRSRYGSAARKVVGNLPEAILASQSFFDDIMAEESPVFSGFDRPVRMFRNGVLHMHIDRPEEDLKWRLG